MNKKILFLIPLAFAASVASCAPESTSPSVVPPTEFTDSVSEGTSDTFYPQPSTDSQGNTDSSETVESTDSQGNSDSSGTVESTDSTSSVGSSSLEHVAPVVTLKEGQTLDYKVGDVLRYADLEQKFDVVLSDNAVVDSWVFQLDRKALEDGASLGVQGDRTLTVIVADSLKGTSSTDFAMSVGPQA